MLVVGRVTQKTLHFCLFVDFVLSVSSPFVGFCFSRVANRE